jgi:hypothetical protein
VVGKGGCQKIVRKREVRNRVIDVVSNSKSVRAVDVVVGSRGGIRLAVIENDSKVTWSATL